MPTYEELIKLNCFKCHYKKTDLRIEVVNFDSIKHGGILSTYGIRWAFSKKKIRKESIDSQHLNTI